MKAASAKAKGRRAERFVADHYIAIKLFPSARPMPMSGSLKEMPGDVWVDGYNRYVEEVKCQETTSIWAWLKQAVSQATEVDKIPVLHFTRNNSPMWTVIPFEEFAAMRKELGR